MKRIQVALLEGHSWPSRDDSTYGSRRYCINSSSGLLEAVIHVLYPWSTTPDRYDLFLVADELCNSRLPFYIPYKQRYCLLKESPIHLNGINARYLRRRFAAIFTHQRRLALLGKPFKFLPFSSNFLGLNPGPFSLNELIDRKDRLCSFVGNLSHNLTHEGYRVRHNAYQVATRDSRVDCFGRDTNPVEYKIEALAPYAFSIAVENANENCYFSEKLVDCILAGTIPLYWGTPSVGDLFDMRGILSFRDSDELTALLSTLSFDLYERLKPFAAENYRRACEGRLASFEGYLQRLVDQLPSECEFEPCRLEFNFASRLKSRIRELASVLVPF